jgi:hypothetical protein
MPLYTPTQVAEKVKLFFHKYQIGRHKSGLSVYNVIYEERTGLTHLHFSDDPDTFHPL